jgi:hypothetical protein
MTPDTRSGCDYGKVREVTAQTPPFTDDEFTVLEAILAAGGDQPVSAIGQLLPHDAARAATAGLLGRGLVTIDRVEQFPAGETVERRVSPLTPSVGSTSRMRVTELPAKEAVAALDDPRTWLTGVHATSWIEAATTGPAEAAYETERKARRG